MTSHHEEHDEFGGLHRDLLQTGATLDRRAGSRRKRKGHVHVDFSGMLLGTMAAHSLRGVSESFSRNECREQDCDFAARIAKGNVRSGVCYDGIRVGASRISRRFLSRLTWCSAMALHSSSRR